jgi:hypothetical protein
MYILAHVGLWPIKPIVYVTITLGYSSVTWYQSHGSPPLPPLPRPPAVAPPSLSAAGKLDQIPCGPPSPTHLRHRLWPHPSPSAPPIGEAHISFVPPVEVTSAPRRLHFAAHICFAWVTTLLHVAPSHLRSSHLLRAVGWGRGLPAPSRAFSFL